MHHHRQRCSARRRPKMHGRLRPRCDCEGDTSSPSGLREWLLARCVIDFDTWVTAGGTVYWKAKFDCHLSPIGGTLPGPEEGTWLKSFWDFLTFWRRRGSKQKLTGEITGVLLEADSGYPAYGVLLLTWEGGVTEHNIMGKFALSVPARSYAMYIRGATGLQDHVFSQKVEVPMEGVADLTKIFGHIQLASL